jgi:hypothetical protein
MWWLVILAAAGGVGYVIYSRRSGDDESRPNGGSGQSSGQSRRPPTPTEKYDGRAPKNEAPSERGSMSGVPPSLMPSFDSYPGSSTGAIPDQTSLHRRLSRGSASSRVRVIFP